MLLAQKGGRRGEERRIRTIRRMERMKRRGLVRENKERDGAVQGLSTNDYEGISLRRQDGAQHEKRRRRGDRRGRIVLGKRR